MFTLFDGIIHKIIDSRTKKTTVLILGIDGSGKTTLKEVLCQHANPTRKPKKIFPTYGLNTETIKEGNIMIRIWDLSGRQNFRSLWEDYYRSCDLVLYLVNGHQIERIHETRKIFDELLCRSATATTTTETSTTTTTATMKPMIVLLFNQCENDIVDIFPSSERVPTFFIDLEKHQNISELYEYIKSTSHY